MQALLSRGSTACCWGACALSPLPSPPACNTPTEAQGLGSTTKASMIDNTQSFTLANAEARNFDACLLAC